MRCVCARRGLGNALLLRVRVPGCLPSQVHGARRGASKHPHCDGHQRKPAGAAATHHLSSASESGWRHWGEAEWEGQGQGFGHRSARGGYGRRRVSVSGGCGVLEPRRLVRPRGATSAGTSFWWRSRRDGRRSSVAAREHAARRRGVGLDGSRIPHHAPRAARYTRRLLALQSISRCGRRICARGYGGGRSGGDGGAGGRFRARNLRRGGGSKARRPLEGGVDGQDRRYREFPAADRGAH
mmetsp:Transcript_16709/g.40280  ORF Transcript_16709/g.40280 Transcript_16709/m.40280 type:complete len:240 (-) Transcript_16709:271-990(-)